jgi:hypothetical protein
MIRQCFVRPKLILPVATDNMSINHYYPVELLTRLTEVSKAAAAAAAEDAGAIL